MVLKLSRLFLFLLITYNVSSQKIFMGEFENTLTTFKNINERFGNKTVMQLCLNENQTYLIQSYVYNKYDKNPKKIKCSEQRGIWSQEKKVLTFNPNTADQSFKYKLRNNKKLYFIGLGKKYARKIRLKKIKFLRAMKCDSIDKHPSPKW